MSDATLLGDEDVPYVPTALLPEERPALVLLVNLSESPIYLASDGGSPIRLAAKARVPWTADAVTDTMRQLEGAGRLAIRTQ